MSSPSRCPLTSTRRWPISGAAGGSAGSARRRWRSWWPSWPRFAGLVVWIELIVREAAIYIAVLFFPVGLAASIWPALRSWVRRLSMLLLMFVLLRPVVVIVLALAGSVTASGLSFGNGSIPHSVGTILAGLVIFALAAFTPWALMFLLGTEIGVMYSRGGNSGGRSGQSSSSSERGGGGLAAEPALAGAGGMAGAGGGAGGASAGGGGGMRMASLGGSGSGGAAASGGVDRSSGRMGRRGGGRGGQGGRAAGPARRGADQVAAGRSGVTPGGIFPPEDGALGGGSASSQSRTADPEPPEPPSFTQGSSLPRGDQGPSDPAADAPASPDAPSPGRHGCRAAAAIRRGGVRITTAAPTGERQRRARAASRASSSRRPIGLA